MSRLMDVSLNLQSIRKEYVLTRSVSRAHQSPGYDQPSWEEVGNSCMGQVILRSREFLLSLETVMSSARTTIQL